MKQTWDVIIVGGGVIGSACAYFLAAAPDFAGSIAVIERDTSYQNASTARSVGGIRQQFSTPENIAMSRFAVEFLRQTNDLLAVDGEAPQLPFTENGYLLMAGEHGHDILQSNVAIQRAEGGTTLLLSPQELSDRFEWLNTSDLTAGSFGPSNEGWTDPYALLQAFKHKARSLGVSYLEDEVAGLDCGGGKISNVKLASGEDLSCGYLVNAAGPHAGAIAHMADLELPVHPRKRYVFVFDCRDAPQNSPLCVDPSGVYFRPEGAFFICGRSPEPDTDFDCLDLDVDYDFFDTAIWPVLANRVPAFEAIKLINAWAGTYAYNTFDQNALVGAHPGVPNMIFANGFSGHGLQQSPAVGRAVSELIRCNKFQTLDLSRFGIERIGANQPIREINVI